MGLGISTAIVHSDQEANAYISQMSSQACNINCQNTLSNTSVDVIHSTILGGINFSQTCSIDAQCVFGNNMDATADVFFKAVNSANAKAATTILNPGANADYSEATSVQDIKESIIQSSAQTCNMTSSNDINNVTVYANDSYISGGINFSQQGNVTGNCILNNTMRATEIATGLAYNTAESGKDKLPQVSWIVVIIVAIVVIVAVFVISKMITSHQAANSAICADGKTKKILDPSSNTLVCPCSDGSLPYYDQSLKEKVCRAPQPKAPPPSPVASPTKTS